MTRRLFVAMVGIVIVTLLIAGFGTFAIAQLRSRRTTERELRQQTIEVLAGLSDNAPTIDSTDPAAAAAALARGVATLRRVKNALHLADFALVTVTRNNVVTGDPLPAGLTADTLPLAQLREGKIVSGVRRGLAYSIGGVAIGPQQRGLAVLVTTRRINAGVSQAIRWLIISSIIALAFAAGVAWWLGRRLARPVEQASIAAHRIARGELDTRLPEPAPDEQDEVADLARSVNAMAAGLQRSKGLEQQFLLSVSHDLRTPLTSIRGYAEAISDGAGDPRRHAQVILGESKRLERLVADLLDLARLQAHSFTLASTPVDLSQVATSAAEGFRPGAAERGLRLDVLATATGSIRADPDRLAQAIANIIENALKYARSTVLVGTAETASSLTLFVDDDGPGIATADLAHVFERLYVARHDSSRSESGSGLGLAIVRELVTAMGGNVHAGPAPSGGARISATFTRQRDPVRGIR
jgi:signal transduction histidine kinase